MGTTILPTDNNIQLIFNINGGIESLDTKNMKLILILILLCLQQVKAATYYVKVAGGNGNGLSDETAWSYSKLNSTNLDPGSIVLFKRGDIFYGKLLTVSGVEGNIITYGAYGSGADPIISGFSIISTWTFFSSNIYYTTVNVPELNVVTLDSKLQGMGRYPKTGYLSYVRHSGNSSITGSTTLPFNPMGAEVVIRKIRQITDRHIITSYRDKTIGLSSEGTYGNVYLNNTAYEPHDGNGYFIQASINTLTNLGDWYYDKSSNRLYMYFGTDTPSSHLIKVSTIAVLSQMDNKNYITFQGIDFEGANREIININNNNNILFANCNFRKSYGCVFADNGMSNLVIQGGSMTDIINNGLFVPQSGDQITVDRVTMNNIGIIPGAGGSGDAMQLGVWIQGNNLTVKNCTLNNIGYHGIVLYGNNTLAEKNLIDTYGLVKDDCGGIYEFQFSNVKHTNKIIRNNIILNGIGVAAGAPPYEQYGQAAAIYLDANVNNVKVYDNILAHGPWGGILLIGVGDNNELRNNLAYDFSKSLLIYNFEDLLIRNITVTNNTFIARTSVQSTLYLQMYIKDNPLYYGTFDNNIYAHPIISDNAISINREYPGGEGFTKISLGTWKSVYSQDVNSPETLVTTDQESNLRFDYNYTSNPIDISLNSTYSDVTNNIYTSSIKLSAYGGSVLIKIPPILYPVQTITSGSWTDRLIWSSSNIPDLKDNVKINSGHTVTVNVDQRISFKTIQIDTGGKLQFIGDFDLSIYPNPAESTIRVQHPIVFNSGYIQVISDDGREVKHHDLIEGAIFTTIDVRFLNPGFYLIRYQNGASQGSARFIKQ
ncbi:right-handed parallel beta-helix repeat-containing protein [Spirosoma endophyticum]|uniref:Por secretion system C-terminal sorting domain-containing protein n=1 Tax=Spirosoma endophyticum TaxID=662367 RepID=A0A1I2FPY4_9BACT|nr:T9SS type A sorting domain-containing protein [Spirosoma endophyticum]SFF07552.1 Por secretion system C-terminal sorting domain-containing protein [Spirosoma endophyticum]